jgi:hypothetical protein
MQPINPKFARKKELRGNAIRTAAIIEIGPLGLTGCAMFDRR